MEFTGERYVSSLKSAQISYEHWHRYLFASSFVEGKSVLDIASGEGYGSSFLAQKAKQVFGVDISAETVSWAKNAYPFKNLTFIEGSCSNIPVPGQYVFDVIVSFETIEHICAEEQSLFLKEIMRLLKPDGLLIISTPNKFLYSDRDNFKNEYHIKEFYRDEFEKFLSKYFNHVALGGQKIYTSSWIWPMKSTELPFIDGNIDLIDNQFTPVSEPKEDLYNIALCCNKNSIEIPYSGLTDLSQQIQKEFFESVGNLIGLKDSEIREKVNIVEEREKQIIALSNSISEKDKQVQDSVEMIREKENQIREISLKLVDSENSILEREVTINERNNIINEKDHIIQEKEVLINEKNNLILEKEVIIDERNNVIIENEYLIQEKEVVINEKCNIIREKENLIQSAEQRIDDLYHSWSWKMTSPLRFLFTQLFNFYYFFFPYGSKRWFFSKAFVMLLIQPHKIIPKITVRNLRILKKALSIEDPLKTDKNFNNYISREVKQTKIEIIFPPVVINEVIPGISVPVFLSPELLFVIASFENTDQLSTTILSVIEHTEIAFKVCLLTDAKHQLDDEKNFDGLDVINQENLSHYLSGLSSLHYISFVNGPVVIDGDTIKQAIDLLKSEVSIGCVIPKVILNNQKLDSAGIIIWNDGSTVNYGYNDNPGLPEYEYVKEVDSGNCFFVAKLDGFRQWIDANELSYASWHYQVYDFSMFLRSIGSSVKYQPLSKIGLISSNRERFETRENDRSLFVQKWNEALSTQHLSNIPENVFLSRERSQGKKIMLMIDHYVPHFDKDAGSKTMKDFIDLYLLCNIRVKFIGDNFFKHQPYTAILQQKGVEIQYGPLAAANWEKWIKKHGKHLSFIFLSRPHIAIKYIHFCRNFTSAKIIFYGHDLHYLREQRQFEITNDQSILKSMEANRKTEQTIFEHADVIYYPSDIEIQRIRQDFKIKKTLRTIVPYIFHDFPKLEYNPTTRKNIMFVGGFNHPPNVDGTLWFLDKVYPIILNVFSDLHFYIIGSNPPEEIKCKSTKNVTVTGYISEDELKCYYQACRIVVAPLRYGSGIKGKIIEAFYHGVPVITTSVGAEGLQEKEKIMLIADEVEAFADLVIQSYNNPEILKTLAEDAYAFLKTSYSKDKALSIIEQDL